MRSYFSRANLLYVPALIFFAVFIVYPFIDGFRISFTNWNGFSEKFKYVGFSNFARLFTDSGVRTSFINTMIYGFGSTIVQQMLGLGCALLLDRKFVGRDVARTILYMPVLISAVIMGNMWYSLVQYNGALNEIVKLFGGKAQFFLSKGSSAVIVILIINSFQYMGISMVIYLAGLQGIPKMYYEAADLEGCSSWKRFTRITVPLLYPAFVTSITINLIGGLKLFDVIKALTGGGPGYSSNSLSTFIHNVYFSSQQAGFAAANGVLLLVTILVITILLQATFRRREIDLT